MRAAFKAVLEGQGMNHSRLEQIRCHDLLIPWSISALVKSTSAILLSLSLQPFLGGLSNQEEMLGCSQHWPVDQMCGLKVVRQIKYNQHSVARLKTGGSRDSWWNLLTS